MNADLHAQLRTLSIDRDHRPAIAPRPRSRWLSRLVLLVVVTGFGAAGWWQRDLLVGFLQQALPAASPATGSPAPEVRLLTVTPAPPPGSEPVLTASGKIVSDHIVQVATKVSGQIVALYFEQGDTVQQGQLLARLEDVVYRARRDEAKAELERSRAAGEFYRWNFDRIEHMRQRNDASDVEYADAKRWRDDSIAKVAADEAALAYAEKLLADTQVVAPIAGVILERNVEVGDFVAAEGGRGAIANAQFATIADMTKLRVEVDVSELDIARIHQDMPASITPDAYKDRRYNGHVLWIDPGANYAKATVQVKVRIDNPDAFLRVEGTAQVAFRGSAPQSGPAQAGLWIPAGACQTDANAADKGRVFVVRDGRAKIVPVTIGERMADRLRISDGLAAGDTIVETWSERIRDGQRVAPR